MKKQTNLIVSGMLCLVTLFSFGQEKIILSEELLEEHIKAVARTITLFENQADAVEMNAAVGNGLGVLNNAEFETGTIEVDLLGENNPGKSFIGIAFNIVDEETYEAIYFRPFNFVAAEQIRKDHMVQYIYHPQFTWSNLRENRTGEFENEISDPPDPDNWFRARIEVSERSIRVFVNDIADPVLETERLATPNSKKIGLWTGNGSSGRFQNLVLINK